MKLSHHFTQAIIKIAVLIILLPLGGCGGRHYRDPAADQPQLPCKLRGACDATVIKYMTKLNKRGVKVITMGQDYLISLPANTLFSDQSPRLMWSSYALLNDVATLLKQFRKVTINVTSYSSQYVSVQRERALTMARSRVVGEYLWSQGVDSRFIFTHGLGSDKPIVRSKQGGDKSVNARVEITFRDDVI